MKLTTSLTNMLGEFVAIQKTPDFKPCTMSMQELNNAVKEEKREYTLKKRSIQRHRFASLGNVSQDVNMNPDGTDARVTMRPSKEMRRDRPSSLVERIKHRFSPSRPNEAIKEEEENEQRKLSSQSEKLHIQIV